jgi:FAD/FMN-containing dehydrogenase
MHRGTRITMKTDLLCNDIHSKLNATTVAEIVFPRSEDDVIAAILRAGSEGKSISICGGRHAMGGQQFGEDTMLLDMTALDFIHTVDRNHGTVEAGAGVKWPELISNLQMQQENEATVWTIRQKQTGADHLTLGGALAANIHGRGLHMKPIIGDVESFRLIGADGIPRHCSRSENTDLFRLAIGGYGCFGVITSVVLRLTPRMKLRRIVEVTTLDLLPDTIRHRIANGCLYGDFQFSIDENSPDFLWKGVLSSYRPVAGDPPVPESQESLGAARWEKLVAMAHNDRANIFAVYSAYYLSTHGNLYWSDTHQLSVYIDDYHAKLDLDCPGSEMITELYVPHAALIPFMKGAAALLRNRAMPVIYGTMRLIRRDDESFLAWATQDYACVIFNLHTEHSKTEIARAADAFRALIDLAVSYQGSYFLTYHRWAERSQVKAAYPNFEEFLREKIHHDPSQVFQSEWWRHYRDMFGISRG